MAGENNTPKTEGIESIRPELTKQAPKWRKVREAIEGEAAIHAAGERYLPKLVEETAKEYRARLGRTPWYNATWRTVAAMLGMLYRKEPTVKAPPKVIEYCKDVTMTGVPFSNFTQELAFEVLSTGLTGILVDHPPRPESNKPVTVAVAEQLGLRPTMALYKAETFIDWKFRRINNKWTLCQLRVFENVSEDSGEFKQTAVGQIRVLDLNPAAGDTYRQRVYRKGNRGWEQYGGDIVPLMNGKPLSFIPFVFVTPNGIVAEADDPPMIDLVDLNIKHYGVSADYEHGCHFTALPTPWVAGAQPDVGPDGQAKPQKLYIGSTRAWTFPNADANVGMLEFSGAGLAALEKNLERKEAQMAALGARMLAPEKTGVEASDTLAMRHSGEQSVLGSIAGAISLGATTALKWFGEWSEADPKECDCEINRNFLPVGMDSATLTALIGAWQQGAISEQELYEKLQQGDVIKSDKTFEDHQGEIEASPPMGVLAQQALIDATGEPDADNK